MLNLWVLDGQILSLQFHCQSNSQSPTDSELTQFDYQSPTYSESTQSQNIGNARTKCLYVHKMPIRSCLIDGYSILYSNSSTRCKYVAVFLRPVNAVLIMLLITYFTTDRVLLSTFVLSVPCLPLHLSIFPFLPFLLVIGTLYFPS